MAETLLFPDVCVRNDDALQKIFENCALLLPSSTIYININFLDDYFQFLSSEFSGFNSKNDRYIIMHIMIYL